ncbi:thioesterase family protein [Ophiostoma piceae UAMH 11346]|uniref:Thioesterase family protein n=1 Tax=Ophiostoma piceae (strain UAMH 11346) TaxID=1262450 RepID=S3BRD1_OPHP1|nr:thioesterase family protein [Ophiostoma piceae UAMH 11346]
MSTLDHVRAHWAGIQPNSPIYNLFFSDIRVVSAVSSEAAPDKRGRVLARLPVAPIHVNSKQILHGAVSAALIDWAGGMAIAAASGTDKTGVSVDIHISYVSAARAGDELEIEAWVSRVGKQLAYTNIEIRRRGNAGADDGAPTHGPVVAMGTHTNLLDGVFVALVALLQDVLLDSIDT